MFGHLIYECRSEVLDEGRRSKSKDKDEGAGDPDLHTKAAEVLGKRGRFKPENANRRDVEEYGSQGRGGVGW